MKRAECIDEKPVDEPEQDLEVVYTPGTKTIKDVCDFLGVEEKQTVKALMFTTFDQDLNPS